LLPDLHTLLQAAPNQPVETSVALYAILAAQMVLLVPVPVAAMLIFVAE
jgi:hypothetical protein